MNQVLKGYLIKTKKKKIKDYLGVLKKDFTSKNVW